MSTESKIRCDKCGSEDILAGNAENPNHCNKCDYEWKTPAGHEKKGVLLGAAACEDITHPLIFRSQPVLFTLNKNYRQNEKLKTKIDEALDALL